MRTREAFASVHNESCPLFPRATFLSRAFLPLLLAALLAFPALAGANGGTIQVASQAAGPYALTVFTSPSPIRVGQVDVSVLVQRAGSNDLAQDVRVLVAAEPMGRPGEAATFDATRDQATNKLYYAANVGLPSEGRWRIEVRASGREGEGAVSFEVEASQASPLDQPPLLALLLMAPPALLAVWWWSRGVISPSRRPPTA